MLNSLRKVSYSWYLASNILSLNGTCTLPKVYQVSAVTIKRMIEWLIDWFKVGLIPPSPSRIIRACVLDLLRHHVEIERKSKLETTATSVLGRASCPVNVSKDARYRARVQSLCGPRPTAMTSHKRKWRVRGPTLSYVVLVSFVWVWPTLYTQYLNSNRLQWEVFKWIISATWEYSCLLSLGELTCVIDGAKSIWRTFVASTRFSHMAQSYGRPESRNKVYPTPPTYHPLLKTMDVVWDDFSYLLDYQRLHL